MSVIDISKAILLFAVFAGLSGCASLKGHNTYVKVVSNPSGADVLLEGKRRLGQTPMYASVPRQKHASLVIRSGDSMIKKELKSSYRWQESFLANFGLISPILWPIGWGTDLISGACWDYENVSPFTFPNAAKDGPYHPVKSVAIAPPATDYEVLSDEMALEIQKALSSKLRDTKILPYDSTSETFVAFNYTHRAPNDPRFNDELYQDLGITHLARSSLEREGGVTRAKVTLHDVFLEKDVGSMQIEIPNSDLTSLSASRTREILLRSVSLIPNSLGVQLVSTRKTQIEASGPGGLSYDVQSVKEEDFFDYISRISIRNVPHPKSMRGFRGRFRFVPDLSYTNDKFFLAQKPSPISFPIETQFRYQEIHAGIGPELGLETPAGYLYGQILPVLSATWIYFDRNGARSYQHKTQLSFSFEFGFLFWVTDNINFRLYTSTLSTDDKLWTTVFQRAGTGLQAGDSRVVTTGFSIGYYFPGVKKIARDTLL